MTRRPSDVALAEVLVHNRDYIDAPEARVYPKLSVKLYGRGVGLDTPADGTTLLMKRHQIARAGQVILSEIWGKKGAVGLVPPEGDGALCTSHFFLFDIRCDMLDPAYLALIFQANYLEEQLGVNARGTTGYAAVRPKHLLAATIPLPEIAEQRRIVERVKAVASRIEEARRLRREAVADLSRLALRVDSDVLGDTSWPLLPLADLLAEDTRNGIGTRPSESPPGVPILRISAATSRRDAIVDESDFKYLSAEPDEVRTYLLKPGDLLACRFNGNLRFVGRFALFQGSTDDDRVFPDKLIRFRVKMEVVSPEFVVRAANGPEARARIESLAATTAGNIGISATALKAVEVRVPELAEQHRVVVYLDGLHRKITEVVDTQSAVGAELDAVVPSVLQRAFAGEL